MADAIVPEIASTIQAASINRHPSPTHDINPSTAASEQKPVILPQQSTPSSPSSSLSGKASIPSDVLDGPSPPHKTVPRNNTGNKPTIPPLPDLRFEQSYLASLKDTKTHWDVIYVTTRDQVILPLLQGALWNLFVSGWRHWNRSSALKGGGLGAGVRRWWWRLNDWPLPEDVKKDAR